jgi:hypothetical protein
MYISVPRSSFETSPWAISSSAAILVWVSSRALRSSCRDNSVVSPHILRAASLARGRHLRTQFPETLSHDEIFFFDDLQVAFKQTISQRNVDFIPPVIPGFVARHKQNCRSPRVKSVKHPKRVAACLGSQLAHFRKTGRLDLRTKRVSQDLVHVP